MEDKCVLDLLQSVRRSHCDRKGMEHACVGTCKITPHGLELSCELCGPGSVGDGHFKSREARLVDIVLKAAGIDRGSLSIEAFGNAINALKSEMNR